MKNVGLAVAVVILTSGAVPAWAQSGSLKVQKSEQYGEYIADSFGRALYMFEADTQGNNGAGAKSACSGDCAVAWPPLTASITQGGEGVSGDLIGTMQRDDGTTQVTYDGWPLYYYAKDANPGDTLGQDIEDFGAEWYLLTPTGEQADDD